MTEIIGQAIDIGGVHILCPNSFLTLRWWFCPAKHMKNPKSPQESFILDTINFESI